MDDERTAGLVFPSNIYKIDGPGVRGGLEIQNDKVVSATDNFHWMEGWPWKEAKRYIEQRGWRLTLAGMDWR